jgi:5'-deoxynucleotidase YfbR-like HD superfamily hydrolase
MDIEIDDIAHGLARVARWNGQTSGDWAFSVAQHCLLVEELLPHVVNDNVITPQLRLMALLHDAPEYVIGDMISPFKNALGIDYRTFEDKLEAAVHLRFSLPAKITKEQKKIIKAADKASAWLEATQLAGFTKTEANKFFGRPKPAVTRMKIKLLPPCKAKIQFVSRFEDLL